MSEKSKLKSEYVSSRKAFDRQVQRAKRLYWFDFQKNLLNDCNNDNVEFWKTIGKVGVGQAQKRRIPMEVVLEDGTVAHDAASVLGKWKRDFSSLLNCQEANTAFPHVIREQPAADPIFNEHISISEVKTALDRSKKGKASGIDQIPVEVLRNDTSVSFLHVLFNGCFDKGIIPSMWNKCIISSIPKSSTTDPRDPLSYRGIALAPSMYKLYCSVLNTRISSWCEELYKINDEQNGFRKNRSTIDHVATLTRYYRHEEENHKLSTYCAFIDFRKAYDCINRDLLWCKLEGIGMAGKLLGAVTSLHTSVSSCVRVNNLMTDWFDVSCGLRQGCCLSALPFNLFINDLALRIKALGKGVHVGDQHVSILLYVEDVVLMADNAQDLQSMLDLLNDWCLANKMSVNASKRNVIHFRLKFIPRVEFILHVARRTF